LALPNRISIADDVVLLVKEEDEMRSMIKRFERYLERKSWSGMLNGQNKSDEVQKGER